jgi:hypothetical protein
LQQVGECAGERREADRLASKQRGISKILCNQGFPTPD